MDRDITALAALSHPNLPVNAPTNRSLDRAGLLGPVGDGGTAVEAPATPTWCRPGARQLSD